MTEITDAEFAEALAAATSLALPDGWRGPLVPLDHLSDDDRIIATPAGGLRLRTPPLPFRYQPADSPRHEDAVVVGRIDRAWIVPGAPSMVWGEGPYDTGSSYYEEAARQLAEGFSNRVSVDLVDATAEMRYLEVETGEYLAAPDRQDEDAWFAMFDRIDSGEVREVEAAVDWKLAASTQVAISAFDEAHIEPVYGYVPTGELAAAPAHQADDYAGGMVALLPATPTELAVAGGDPAEDLHVTLAFLGDDVNQLRPETLDALRSAALDASRVGPIDAVVAGYGTLGSEDPPATVLFLNGYGLADAHRTLWGTLRATEVQDLPEQHSPFLSHLTLGYGLPLEKAAPYVGRSIQLDTVGLFLAGQVERYAAERPLQQLVAAIGATFAAADFTDPKLPGPTPWTVTEDGRVFGHLATWNVCHIGFADVCVTAPSSPSSYAYFHVGEVQTDAGPLPVGKITLGNGHADAHATAAAAAEHYDNTCAAAAVVRAGEDDYGIWVAGRVLPGLSSDRQLALSLSPLSGDWRSINGQLELVAALAVNTPGFPVPRGVAASGRQVSLTAAGVLPPPLSPANRAEDSDIDDRVARRVLAELAAQPRRRQQAVLLARRTGRDPRTRAAELAARIHQTGE